MSQLQIAKMGRKAAVAIDRSIDMEMEMEGDARRDALQIEQFSAHMVSYLTSPVCVLREI